MSRTVTLTQKIPTKFGSLYAHVDLDRDRRVVAVTFSTPGKFDNTELDDVIKQLGEAVTDLLKGEDHADREAAQGAGDGTTGEAG